MRARWLDPQGSLGARALPFVATLAASGAVFGAGAAVGSFGPASLFLVAAAPLVASLLPWRLARGPRDVELALGPGHVDVREGSHRERLAARAITGASTAKTPRGLLLTLAVHRRLAPVTLELASEAEAEEVRRALGIGHGGVGAVAWTPAHEAGTLVPTGGLVVSAALCVIGYLLTTSDVGNIDLGTILLSMVSYLGPALALAATPLMKTPNGGRSLLMRADGLHVRVNKVTHLVPYADIQDVRVEPSRVVVVGREELAVPRRARSAGGVGLTTDEAEVMRAQVLAASARARGFATPKEETAARLETLRRDRNETSRAWLERLEGLGKGLVTGVGGYRGGALEAGDLWRALEDPEADPGLRVACARVLRAAGLPEARVRIASAVEATRDERLLAKLRVVSHEEDVQTAGEALAGIEVAERAEEDERLRRAAGL